MAKHHAGMVLVVISEGYVRAVASEELDALYGILAELEHESSLDEISQALMEDDLDCLKDDLDEQYEAFVEANDRLLAKFKEVTGLTLSHYSISSDLDETELEDGHHFALDFNEVYQYSPGAEAAKGHISLEIFTTYFS